MSNTEIRVVTGPANYFSHPGSLSRLNDFFTTDQLSRAVWVYGERAIDAAALICQRHFISPRLSACCLRDIAAKPMLLNWQKSREIIAAW